jgi:UDP-glucose 6-dehydrogenase
MKIAIVGLVTWGWAFGRREMSHQVSCADCDAGKIAKLNADRTPIHEPTWPIW